MVLFMSMAQHCALFPLNQKINHYLEAIGFCNIEQGIAEGLSYGNMTWYCISDDVDCITSRNKYKITKSSQAVQCSAVCTAGDKSTNFYPRTDTRSSSMILSVFVIDWGCLSQFLSPSQLLKWVSQSHFHTPSAVYEVRWHTPLSSASL